MATYKGIQGYSVQTLASDPSPTASAEGQLWYNTTSSTWKIAAGGAGAWAAGGAMNHATRQAMGAGIQTAALAIAGYNVPGTPGSSEHSAQWSEEYNGSAWTEQNQLNVKRYGGIGCGTQTAAITAAGYNPGGYVSQAEEYNGTTWTEVADVIVARSDTQGCGTQSAAMMFGGTPPTTRQSNEIWNGTSWAEENDLVAHAVGSTGIGLTTAALCVGGGGNPPSPTGTDQTQSWNGTSWTEVNDLNTARRGAGGSGIQTAGIYASGWTAPSTPTTVVEQYDGTSWTEVGDVGTGRGYSAAGGSSPSTLSIIYGGNGGPPGESAATEEWSEPVYSVKTVTTS